MIPQHLSEVEKTLEFKSDSIEKLKSERAIVHFISTPDLDRARDILDPKGMDDKEFSQVPSVWYNHNYKYNPDAMPVAKSLWRKRQEDGVLTKTQFATTDFAEDVYNLHSEGFISSWSVGISQAKDKTGKPIPLRYDEKKEITYWDNWRLLEYSSAPMPANIYAQDVIKNMKEVVKSETMKNLVENMEFKSELVQKFQDQQVILDELKKNYDELKSLSELKVSDDLDKAEREILELKSRIEVLENKLTKKSGENLGGLKVSDLQAGIKRAIAGEFSRRTGKQ